MKVDDVTEMLCHHNGLPHCRPLQPTQHPCWGQSLEERFCMGLWQSTVFRDSCQYSVRVLLCLRQSDPDSKTSGFACTCDKPQCLVTAILDNLQSVAMTWWSQTKGLHAIDNGTRDPNPFMHWWSLSLAFPVGLSSCLRGSDPDSETWWCGGNVMSWKTV